MNGVYLKYIDVPPNLKATLSSYSTTHTNSSLSTISLANLKISQPEQINYATFEKNYWKLNGTYRGITGQSTLIWSDDVTVGSTNQIYVTGTTLVLRNIGRSGFTNKPTLTRIWSEYQTIPGVQLIFYQPDYCSDLNIKWYHDSTLIADENFYPDSQSYFCEKRVEMFNKAVITFNAMTKVNRFLKVVDLWEGQTVEFTNPDLRKLNILEEIDPTSDSIPFNQMNIEFSHKIDNLNLVFQNKQVIEVYFNDVLYGKFFINASATKYDVTATDFMGLLDTAVFMGNYYDNVPANTILAEIFNGEDYISYVSNISSSTRLKGIIKKCTKREALAQVLFAVNAYANDSRSETLNINYTQNPSGPYTIPADKTFLSGRNNIYSNPVTEVRLTVHNYVLKSEAEELFSTELTAGTYTIEFSDPISTSTATISGATFTTLGATYAIINVASAGTVTISAQVYEDNPAVKTGINTNVLSGTPTNIVEYTDKTLVSSSNADAVLNRLLHFNSLNRKYETKVKATNKVGDLANVYPDLDSEMNTGRIVKFDYKLRKNQIGNVTLLLDDEGGY